MASASRDKLVIFEVPAMYSFTKQDWIQTATRWRVNPDGPWAYLLGDALKRHDLRRIQES